MQDFQSAPAGLAGRIFFGGGGGGGGGGGDGGDAGDFRRFRGYPMIGGAPPAAAQQQLPVKCPRCESTNTKFCYYNNYNLSQPRHFCKACRRYWTKGGVLRNVPVGGGCRKAKRSSSSSSSSSSKSSSKSSASGDKDGQQRRSSSSASRLSSDSSGITTAGPGDASASGPPFSDANLSNSNNPNSISVDPQFHQLVENTPPCSEPETLPEPHPSGSFANLVVPSAAPSASPVAFLGFGFSDLSPVRLPTGQQKTVEEIRVQEEDQQQQQQQEGFIVDHTIASDLRPVTGAGGLGALDWPTSVDPALFDLTSAVDPGAYWNQSHWGDTDASLYLP